MSLLNALIGRVRAIMVENINSANHPAFQRSMKRDQHSLIKEIIKEFGTPIGPRRRAKNVNVFFEVQQELGTIVASQVVPAIGTAFGARSAKSYEWDKDVFGLAKHKMASHDYHLYALHLVHVSEVDPSQVAFTPDERSLLADKQLRMRPGKYLTKYWGSGSPRPLFSEDQIRSMVEAFTARGTPKALHLVPNTDPDGWEWVYENSPLSCMRYNRSARYLESGLYGPDHPVRLYANPDNNLALAYIMVDGKPAPTSYEYWSSKDEFCVAARTIVNVVDKTYLRIYSDGDTNVARVMEAALNHAGFTHSEGTLYQQRLVRRTNGDSLICPYLDGNYTYVQDTGDCLIISDTGIDGQQSAGLLKRATCQSCWDAVLSEEDLTYCHDSREYICQSCLEDYIYAWVSLRCQEWVHSDSGEIYEYNGEYYTSGGLAANGLSVCDHCGEVNDGDSLCSTEHQWVCECHTTVCEVSGDTILEEDSTNSDYDGTIYDAYRVRLYPFGGYGHEDRVFSLTTSRGVTHVHQEFLKTATEDDLRIYFVVIGGELLPSSAYGDSGRPPRHGDAYTNVVSGNDCDDNIESYMDSILEKEREAA